MTHEIKKSTACGHGRSEDLSISTEWSPHSAGLPPCKVCSPDKTLLSQHLPLPLHTARCTHSTALLYIGQGKRAEKSVSTLQDAGVLFPHYRMLELSSVTKAWAKFLVIPSLNISIYRINVWYIYPWGCPPPQTCSLNQPFTYSGSDLLRCTADMCLQTLEQRSNISISSLATGSLVLFHDVVGRF